MINPIPATYIETGELSDIEDMDRVEQEAFNTPWSRELLRAAILNDQYQVRVLHSEDVGLLGFYIAHDVKGKSNLDNLVVEGWARNQGHGSTLILDWIEQSQNLPADMLTLQVNTANKRAQALYERFDFRTSRLLVSYYPNGEDAYQMVRAMDDGEAGAPHSRWQGIRRLRRNLIG